MALAETIPSRPWKKSKTVAILLAVFLGPWTWLYTYRRDAWKATLGLGLGLSISSRIVKEHGGTLTFASEPGKGTTAEIFLPVHQPVQP
jgi:hypothetical protein